MARWLVSESILQQQLRDTLLVEEAVYEKMKISSDERNAPTIAFDVYERVVKELEREKVSHAHTKAELIQTQDKLEVALGEIEVLKKQVDREKLQFEKTFNVVKSKATKEIVKNAELEEKCEEAVKQCEETQTVLVEKEKAIEGLACKLVEQEEIYRQRIIDLHVQLQQEKYIAKTINARQRKIPLRSLSATRTKK